MRTEGTLAKWNDDRGFGFITPTQGGAEIFAHVSAFPRDGQRPRIGERLTFEIGTGKDGKKQARNILCPTRPTEKSYRLSEPPRRHDKPGLFGRLIPLFVIALGAYGYNEYTHRATPRTADAVQSSNTDTPAQLTQFNQAIQPPSPTLHAVQSSNTAAPTSPFHCNGRQYCSDMHSRAEAEYFLSNCPDTRMDGDHDGIPCENDSRF